MTSFKLSRRRQKRECRTSDGERKHKNQNEWEWVRRILKHDFDVCCAHYTFVRNATMCSSGPKQTDRQSDRQKNVWRNEITGKKTYLIIIESRLSLESWIYLSKLYYCVWFVHRTPAHSHIFSNAFCTMILIIIFGITWTASTSCDPCMLATRHSLIVRRPHRVFPFLHFPFVWNILSWMASLPC